MGNTRRQFLKRTLGAVTACGMSSLASADDSPSPVQSITDTHVYLGHWPHKRLAGEEPEKLAQELRQAGVGRAWVGSFDGLFHKDIAGVNQRLADICLRIGKELFIPFGSVNPTLPDWEDDLRRCHEVHHMPGVRLHPNYHGYTLDDPRFDRMLEIASKRSLVVQIAAWLEAGKHFLLSPHVERVNLAPLAQVVARHPKVKLVVANGLPPANEAETRSLLLAETVWFDFGRADSERDLRNLVEQASPGRVVLGSGAPLHDMSQVIRTMEQSRLTGSNLQAIALNNAARLTNRQ